MSRHQADELWRLENGTAPAWLWDADRVRVVWANRPGLAFWNETSLLDLLDRRFDPSAPALRRLAGLAETLTSGKDHRETLLFPGTDGPVAVEVLVRVHPLDDGRTGVLVVESPRAAGQEESGGRAGLLMALLQAVGQPVAAFDAHGSLIFRNAACADFSDAGEGASEPLLSAWFGDPDTAASLIDQLLREGLVSLTCPVRTRWGLRMHRVTARAVAAQVHGRIALVFLFDDIEDRQRLERRRERDVSALRSHLHAVVDIIFTLDTAGRLADIVVLGDRSPIRDPSALIGHEWVAAADALGLALAPDVMSAMVSGQAVSGVRATLAGADDHWEVVVGAVPISGKTGKVVGVRGSIVGVDSSRLSADRKVGGPRPDQPGNDRETLAAIGRAVAENAGGLVEQPVDAEVPAVADAPAEAETVGTADAQVDVEAPAAAEAMADVEWLDTAAEAARSETSETDSDTAAQPGAPLRVVGGVEHAALARAAPLEKPRFVEPLDIAKSPIPSLVHRAFDVVFANDALATLLDRSLVDQRLEERNLLTLFPEERVRLFGLQGRVDDGDVLQPGEVGMIPLKAALPDGSSKTLLTRLERVFFDEADAVLMQFEDPEAVPAAEVEGAPASSPQQPATAEGRPSGLLVEAQRQVSELSAILNSAADGIVALDADGNIVTMNTSAETIFQVRAVDRVGSPLTALFTRDSGREIGAYIQSVGQGEVSRLEREGREAEGVRPDGSGVSLFVTIGRISVEDGPRFCAVLRDISNWKSAETDLRRAKDAAEQASTQKSDFLARISHELRTPLNAIIGFSEVMSEEKFGPIENDRYKEYLTDIHSSGEHLLSLINDLLDLSKIESGKLELNFASVDLTPLIQQCMALMQPQATRERVIMRSSLPDKLSPVVADERSIRQILLNLLSNAIKFTPPGGQVILSVLIDDTGCLQVRIRDTGRGMSQDEMERAMEPFRQIDSGTTTSELAGTGLGLPLTKALTEANRAEFRIESTPQAGTLVQITFPPERVLAG